MVYNEPKHTVIINVTESKCPKINVGDKYYINGSQFLSSKSDDPCLTALISINPWIIASRFGIQSNDLGWDRGYNVYCPDNLVKFNITYMEEHE